MKTIKIKVSGTDSLAHPLAQVGPIRGQDCRYIVAVNDIPDGVSAGSVLRRFSRTFVLGSPRSISYDDLGLGKIVRPAS